MADANANEVPISLTKNHVCDYIKYRLKKYGYEWTTCPKLRPTVKFNTTVRTLGDKFELRFKESFTDMSSVLHITPSSAHPTFVEAVNELFKDEITWGRIMALFTFGGSLAVQVVDKEMPHLVDHIAGWVTTYIDDNIIQWINDNGSWDGLVEFYDQDQIDESRWPKFRNFVCGMAAGALSVLTLGAILTTRS